jgi:hypothetical protein
MISPNITESEAMLILVVGECSLDICYAFIERTRQCLFMVNDRCWFLHNAWNNGTETKGEDCG